MPYWVLTLSYVFVIFIRACLESLFRLQLHLRKATWNRCWAVIEDQSDRQSLTLGRNRGPSLQMERFSCMLGRHKHDKHLIIEIPLKEKFNY